MISGYCEEKYTPVKKIFDNYFLKQEEIGASFAIYKEGKPLIDLYGGFKNKVSDIILFLTNDILKIDMNDIILKKDSFRQNKNISIQKKA
jgi:hypothetical protein